MKTTLSNRRGGELALYMGRVPVELMADFCLFRKGNEPSTAAAAAESGSDVSVTTQFERQHTIGLRIEWNEEEGSEKRKETKNI